MNAVSLHPDCERCAALCCLSLAFDRSELFAIDKAAGVTCPNLDAGHGCAIHRERVQQGFGGCVAYDCLGAGQRVTQELFGGRSWRDDAALTAPMMDAFWRLRQVHEALAALRSLSQLQRLGHIELPPPLAERRGELEHALQTHAGAAAALSAFERERQGAALAALLEAVRAHAAVGPRRGERVSGAPRRLSLLAPRPPPRGQTEPVKGAKSGADASPGPRPRAAGGGDSRQLEPRGQADGG